MNAVESINQTDSPFEAPACAPELESFVVARPAEAQVVPAVWIIVTELSAPEFAWAIRRLEPATVGRTDLTIQVPRLRAIYLC